LPNFNSYHQYETLQNKSVFSLVPRLLTRHCPHLLLSAVLRRRCCCAPAPVCYRSKSPARRTPSSTPAVRRCCCGSMGQTDGRTDARSTALCSSYYADSVNSCLSLHVHRGLHDVRKLWPLAISVTAASRRGQRCQGLARRVAAWCVRRV